MYRKQSNHVLSYCQAIRQKGVISSIIAHFVKWRKTRLKTPILTIRHRALANMARRVAQRGTSSLQMPPVDFMNAASQKVCKNALKSFFLLSEDVNYGL